MRHRNPFCLLAMAVGLVAVLSIGTAQEDAAGEDEKAGGVADRGFEKRWREIVPEQKDAVIRYFERHVLPEQDRIASYFALGPEEVERLQALLDEALDAAANSYVEACREAFLELDHDDRQRALDRAQRGVVFSNRPNFREFEPTEEPAWEEGLGELLGERKLREWKKRADRLESERWTILTEHLVLLIDDAIGLSTGQRDAIHGEIRSVIEEESSVAGLSLEASISPRHFSGFLSEASHVEGIREHLDEVQEDRFGTWAESVTNRSVKAPVKRIDRRDGESRDRYHERIIARVVRVHEKGNEDVLRNRLFARVDLIDRAVDLDPEQRSRLELSMRGVVEYTSDSYRSLYESSVRRWIESARGGDFDEHYDRYLDNLRLVRVQRVVDETIAEETIARTLTDAQAERWEELDRERKKFRRDVCLRLLRFRCEAEIGLRESQWNDLVDPLVAAMEDRVPELERYLPSTTPWFFHAQKGYYPFLGIDEKTFRSILTEKQWDLWKGGPASQAERYENYIRTIRERKTAEDGGEADE